MILCDLQCLVYNTSSVSLDIFVAFEVTDAVFADITALKYSIAINVTADRAVVLHHRDSSFENMRLPVAL